MMSIVLLATASSMKTINPTKYAFLILGISLLVALTTFKISLTSWTSLVLIMIFSSGMMTLFIYVTSLVPNEKSKNKIPLIGTPILILNLNSSSIALGQSKKSMKTFSYQTLILIMTTILIITMLAISLQSFNPQQSMSSTF